MSTEILICEECCKSFSVEAWPDDTWDGKICPECGGELEQDKSFEDQET